MVKFTDASSSHSVSTAIHNAEAFGMATSIPAASAAPTRKYGRRRPNRVQVRSE